MMIMLFTSPQYVTENFDPNAKYDSYKLSGVEVNIPNHQLEINNRIEVNLVVGDLGFLQVQVEPTTIPPSPVNGDVVLGGFIHKQVDNVKNNVNDIMSGNWQDIPEDYINTIETQDEFVLDNWGLLLEL